MFFFKHRTAGGIKLGAGGLIRAYGSCARLVLRQASKTQVVPKSMLAVTTSSAYCGQVHSLATKYSADIREANYQDDGSVHMQISLNTENLMQIMDDIRDTTRGTALFSNDIDL